MQPSLGRLLLSPSTTYVGLVLLLLPLRLFFLCISDKRLQAKSRKLQPVVIPNDDEPQNDDAHPHVDPTTNERLIIPEDQLLKHAQST